MTWEVLASGLFSAALVFVLGIAVNIRNRAMRVRGNWGALLVEMEECGRIADGYINSNIAAPSYRLPTLCYENCLPALLADAAIDEDGTKAILLFYAEVQTFNRGLDLADAARGGDGNMPKEFRRNCLKANRIRQPSGDLYMQAHEICEKRKQPPGSAILAS